ncbi:M23 family metallopeptidase, partial [Micromonospora sp. AMSO12t]|uniref:M23 family metallopeptidase n=1 Tax=Micromonospora sp. AMSO12t TaxID=2650410 RepID=UPI001CED488C
VLSNRCGATDSDHYGVDVAGNGGTAIGAAYPGTVAFAGWTSGGGNMVTLSHASGYQTRYLHMAQPASVALGQQVGQGQVLGYVGSTGNSTGPHLHFEIRRNGAVHNIAPAYACGATVTKGAPINLPFPDLTPAGAAPDRFAFVNSAGVLYAKDGAYSSWQAVNAGGATKVVLSGNRIGWVQGGNFYVKEGVYGQWLTLAGGGQVRDIAVSGDRFAFVNSAGVLYAKDGAYSSWQAVNSGGATRVVLSGNRIGWVQGGNFYAKDGIQGGWLALAEGGQVSDVAVGGDDWFAFVGGGNFFAKQGVHAGWLTMAGGGQVGDVDIAT